RFYTPTETSEVGITQRHNGRFGTGYRIQASASNMNVFQVVDVFARFEGIEIIGVSNGRSGIRTNTVNVIDIYISECLIHDNSEGIDVSTMGAGSKVYAWNNVIYDNLIGFDGNYGTAGLEYFIYNNTIVDNSTDGVSIVDAIGDKEVTMYNNLCQGNGADYDVTNFTVYLHGNNIAGETSSPDDAYDSLNVIFDDEINNDFHLSPVDTAARNAGTNLSGDTPSDNDIDGNARPNQGVWDIGADEAALGLFYSVGQDTATNNRTGTPTITIADGLAEFDIAQTGNIGVGDKVTYDTTSVAYISRKVDTSHWYLVTATGGVPANEGVAVDVDSINRTFGSLFAAEAGATGGSYLNDTNLVTTDTILHLSCYYDTGADTTPVNVSGYTTGPNNYIKIYTPNNTSTEANNSQRHNGKWDDGKYVFERQSTNATYLAALTISDDYVRIDGLQLAITYSHSNSRCVSISSLTDGNNLITVSNNIIKGSTSTDSVSGTGFYFQTQTNVIRFWNNLVYGFKDANNSSGIGVSVNGTSHSTNFIAYNNTSVGNYRGFHDGVYHGGVLKNNISYGNTVNYNGTFDEKCSYNLSGPSQIDAPGSNPINSAVVAFVDSSSYDYHLSSSDTRAKDVGLDLVSDSYLILSSDIDGETRPYNSIWDLGADEMTINVFQDSASGNWNSGATWGNTGNSEGVDYPVANDIVTIDAGVITLSQNESVGDITINGAGRLALGAYTLNADGNWTVSAGGVLTAGTGSVNFRAAAGTKIITSNSQTFNNLTINSSASGAIYQPADELDINGGFILVNGTFDLATNDPVMHVGTTFLLAGGTFTKGAGTINFDGDLTYTDSIGSINIGNLVIGGSPETTDLASDLVADTLTINYSDQLNTNGYDLDIAGIIDINGTLDATDDVEGDGTTIAVGGNWDMTGGTFTIANSSVTFDSSASGNTITSDLKSFYDILFNNAGGDWALSDDMLVDNSLTVTSGEFQG
ncbi:MAG: hypothetical protein KKD07_10845, partial [Candidatus Omnitrophica bacterium]|nr:hypothetical protein [Candidatus Omnitrophota bacterium]